MVFQLHSHTQYYGADGSRIEYPKSPRPVLLGFWRKPKILVTLHCDEEEAQEEGAVRMEEEEEEAEGTPMFTWYISLILLVLVIGVSRTVTLPRLRIRLTSHS